MTKISKTFRREILIGGEPHTITVGLDGVTIMRKGHRKNASSIGWGDLLARAAPGTRA